MEEAKFKQLDVVRDYSDHHFISKHQPGNSESCCTNTNSEVYKKIMQEWRILEENLPDSIFVRVYEDRIDLLRAMIIGAAGTPYHDGLFFFDIFFPPKYPEDPPEVYYHSFGLRLNPNLYPNGNVCLSLLNTWVGEKEESWNPSCSTILQVLVSLQALVLIEKPYYNDHIFFRKDGSSKMYNETVFELSCRTMKYVIRRPPKNFESLVSWHFHKRAKPILRACRAYKDGHVMVGCYQDGGLLSHEMITVSGHFMQSMAMLYQELFVAFTNIGLSLQDIVEEPQVERNNINSETQTIVKQKKQGIWHKIMGKIVQIFGMKKDGEKSKNKKLLKNTSSS